MGGSASVIDGLSDTVVTTIKIRGAPVAMCSCTPHDKVYCAGTEPSEPAPDTSTNHAVSVIDCRTNRVIKELEVPMDDGSRIVYDSLRDRVYVTVGSGIDARVTMIDAGRDKVVATRPAGIGPDRREGIAGRLGARATGEVVYAPRHKRVFAASEQNSVVVLREDRGSEDIGQALRQFSRSVGNWWGRLSRPAERAQTGI
jgi:DNA-binding beta-propeller fold protein YncE